MDTKPRLSRYKSMPSQAFKFWKDQSLLCFYIIVISCQYYKTLCYWWLSWLLSHHSNRGERVISFYAFDWSGIKWSSLFDLANSLISTKHLVIQILAEMQMGLSGTSIQGLILNLSNLEQKWQGCQIATHLRWTGLTLIGRGSWMLLLW